MEPLPTLNSRQLFDMFFEGFVVRGPGRLGDLRFRLRRIGRSFCTLRIQGSGPAANPKPGTRNQEPLKVKRRRSQRATGATLRWSLFQETL